MRVNQVTTASIRLGIHMPGIACRAAIHPENPGRYFTGTSRKKIVISFQLIKK